MGLGWVRDPGPETLPDRRQECGTGVQLVEPVRGVRAAGARPRGDHEQATAAGRRGPGDGIGAAVDATADEHACGGRRGAGVTDGAEPVPEQLGECCGAVGAFPALGEDLGEDFDPVDASTAAYPCRQRLMWHLR